MDLEGGKCNGKRNLKMDQKEQYIKRPRGQREMAGWRN